MAAPTVTAVAPASGTLAGGTIVTVTGTGFFNGGTSGAVTAIHFGATAATQFNVISDTSLTVVSPAHAAGTIDITVTTPGGTSATSSADDFTFNPTVATQVPGPPGAVITFQAANAASIGDTFVGDGRTEFRIHNGAVAPITATFKGQIPCSQGHLHDQTVTVGAGTEETAGPFNTSQFTDPATGMVFVTYSSATSVTVAAVRVA